MASLLDAALDIALDIALYAGENSGVKKTHDSLSLFA